MSGRRTGMGSIIDGLAKWLLKYRIFNFPARVISNSRFAWSFVSRLDRVRVRRQKDRLEKWDLPNHNSIIMDGNRRFAWNLSVATEVGHKHGKEKLKEVMDWVLELEIPYLTVYALSSENISSRDSEELDSLYDLYVTGLHEISEDPRIHSKQVKVKAAGRIEKLPKKVRDAIEYAEQKTKKYSNFTFTVCLAYVPDPDLVIRTSGEERVSNFLLWQIAYSELYFTDVHWPSFSKGDLYDAIETFQMRRRRYGR